MYILQQQLSENNNPITQTNKAEHLSNRYQFVNTNNLIDVFLSNGFNIVGNSVAGSRNHKGYQKHTVAFTKPELDFGKERMQLLLTNSHDGRSSIKINLGIYRLVCANGLVVGSDFAKYKANHTGNVLDYVNDIINLQLNNIDKVLERVNRFKDIELSPEQAKSLLMQAALLRNENTLKAKFNPKRPEDLGHDLWTVYNRAQEGIIRGGMKLLVQNTDEPGQSIKTLRGIKSPARQIELNQKLWNIADTFAIAA